MTRVEHKERVTAHIKKFLGCVYRPGDTFELRTIGPVRSLTTTDYAVAADWAYEMNETGANTYYTINPVSAHRGSTSTASDADVTQRYQYFIDVDPERQQLDKKVMSTNEEKAAGWSAVEMVRHYLEKSNGWPVPIIIDSGSGYHLLYQGDGCDVRTPEWNTIVRNISRNVSSKMVKVDTVVTNPSRIARLPGTKNRKGADTPTRPWRRSQVIEWSPDRGTVSYEQVQKLAAKIDPSARQRSAAQAYETTTVTESDIVSLVKTYPQHLKIVGIQRKPYMTLIKLDDCPFAGRRHDMSLASFVLRPDGGIGFRCLADGCIANERNLGFREMLYMLRKKTGIRHHLINRCCSMAELDALWGGVDDVGPPTKTEIDEASELLGEYPSISARRTLRLLHSIGITDIIPPVIHRQLTYAERERFGVAFAQVRHQTMDMVNLALGFVGDFTGQEEAIAQYVANKRRTQ